MFENLPGGEHLRPTEVPPGGQEVSPSKLDGAHRREGKGCWWQIILSLSLQKLCQGWKLSPDKISANGKWKSPPI